jgi:hypothetical protein
MQQSHNFFRRAHPARKHHHTVYHEGRRSDYAISHYLPDILDDHDPSILAACPKGFQCVAKERLANRAAGTEDLYFHMPLLFLIIDEVTSVAASAHLLCERITHADVATKKPGRQYPMIFRRPGYLNETLWAFRPTLAGGLVFSSITQLTNLAVSYFIPGT